MSALCHSHPWRPLAFYVWLLHLRHLMVKRCLATRRTERGSLAGTLLRSGFSSPPNKCKITLFKTRQFCIFLLGFCLKRCFGQTGPYAFSRISRPTNLDISEAVLPWATLKYQVFVLPRLSSHASQMAEVGRAQCPLHIHCAWTALSHIGSLGKARPKKASAS